MGDFDFNIIVKSLPILWDGLLLSIKLFLIALVGGIFFGTLLANVASDTGFVVVLFPKLGISVTPGVGSQYRERNQEGSKKQGKVFHAGFS